jgi:hypothetical protein
MNKPTNVHSEHFRKIKTFTKIAPSPLALACIVQTIEPESVCQLTLVRRNYSLLLR